MADRPATGDIDRQLHDACYRAMVSDPAHANAVVRAHWPRQLRWTLEGATARPFDSALVQSALRQRWTDSLCLVGGGAAGQPRLSSRFRSSGRAG